VSARRWYYGLLVGLLGAALIGIAISLWAHVVSLLGIDPGAHFRGFWVFQLLLFVLMLPIAIELFRRQPDGGILRSPRWMRRILFALLLYYGINFYVFLYWSSNHLSAAVTWRMFSAGWLLLFTVAAVYYRVRWVELRQQDGILGK
jgi:hypothetical protein